jgi:hypothetical protein
MELQNRTLIGLFCAANPSVRIFTQAGHAGRGGHNLSFRVDLPPPFLPPSLPPSPLVLSIAFVGTCMDEISPPPESALQLYQFLLGSMRLAYGANAFSQQFPLRLHL